jgi:glucose/arabinose dehydrogenase/plastocyanin
VVPQLRLISRCRIVKSDAARLNPLEIYMWRFRGLVTLVLSLLILAPLGSLDSTGRAQLESKADAAVTAPALLGGDLPGDPQVQLVQVASNFQTPVNVAFPPDGSGRMFVVEVGGTIRVVNPDGTVMPQPFLDLSSTVALRPGQQGLLGLAFHPNYAENGRLFVDYNNLYANGQITVSEFLVSEDDPNTADKKTERPLLTIDKPYPQHNGGTLRFGPDGFLYISTGDGGWQGDPYDNAQSRFSLLGKILRIDVDSGAAGQPYGIPADNPFAGPGRYDNPYPGEPPQGQDSGGRRARNKNVPNSVSAENRKNRSPVRPEIWAYGFRNPWQFSFDPGTGDFYVGDVGGDNWEEIDFQEAGTIAGQNYGWDWLEASHCYPAGIEECPRQQVGVLPIAEYAHGDDGCAVIGLGVYRGDELPTLDGIYFSGEFCTGEIRGLQRDAEGVWQFENLLDTALQLTGSGQDERGNLYVAAVTSQRETDNGSVWKLVSADQAPADATTVPLGEPAQGEAEVDEFGAPVGEAGEETGAAGDTAEPVTEVARVDETVTPDEEASAATPAVPEAGASDAEIAQSRSTPVSAAAEAIVIGMYDIYFEPDRIRMPANTDVRFVFENRGAAPHNFEIKERDISIDVAPGETAEAVINLPPGTYKFICNVPGHKQVGMNGALVVE